MRRHDDTLQSAMNAQLGKAFAKPLLCSALCICYCRNWFVIVYSGKNRYVVPSTQQFSGAPTWSYLGGILGGVYFADRIVRTQTWYWQCNRAGTVGTNTFCIANRSIWFIKITGACVKHSTHHWCDTIVRRLSCKEVLNFQLWITRKQLFFQNKVEAFSDGIFCNHCYLTGTGNKCP